MHRVILLLMVFASFVSVAGQAAATPVEDCTAGLPGKLTMETQVRTILVETLGSNPLNGVQVSVCIDSLLPGATSARFALMSVTGHLLAIFGEDMNAGHMAAHGSVHSYFFTSSDATLKIDFSKLADHVVVQPIFGQQTYAFLHRARFQGITGHGFGKLAPDSCLGGLPHTMPKLRDVAVVIASDDTNYTAAACLVSPVGHRITDANVVFHLLYSTKTVDGVRLYDVPPGGDGLPGMHPLVGFPHGAARTIGLWQVQISKTPPVPPADPYSIMIVEPSIHLCRQTAGGACTPDVLIDSPTTVRFAFRHVMP